jgi:hypothetical protein
MNFDSKTTVDFPACNVWGEYYSKFRKSILAKLNSHYCLADREDAVEHAFYKLMNKKDIAAYGDKMPKTENGWFWALYWQAKAYLSHMKEHGIVHAKYVEEMAKELENVFVPGYVGGLLDNGVYSDALALAFTNLMKDHDLRKRDFSVFIATAIYRKSARSVAKDYCLTENNVYQIKFRMARILEKYGRKYFTEALERGGNNSLRLTA